MARLDCESATINWHWIDSGKEVGKGQWLVLPAGVRGESSNAIEATRNDARAGQVEVSLGSRAGPGLSSMSIAGTSR